MRFIFKLNYVIFKWATFYYYIIQCKKVLEFFKKSKMKSKPLTFVTLLIWWTNLEMIVLFYYLNVKDSFKCFTAKLVKKEFLAKNYNTI